MSNTTPRPLTQANFLGQGFDISGGYYVPQDLPRRILDPSKVGTHEFTFLKQSFLIPDYVIGTEATSTLSHEETVETRDEFQNSISAKAGVEVNAGAFSAQMEAAYGSDFAKSGEHSYSFINFYQRLALLSLNAEKTAKALSQGFIDAYTALPDEASPETLKAFAEFFRDFGYYVTSELALGGVLEYYVAVDKRTQMTTREISAQVKAEYNGVFVAGGISGDIKYSEEYKKFATNRKISIIARGGDPPLLTQLINVGPGDASRDTAALYDEWVESIEEAPTAADFKLAGVWEFIPDEHKRKRDAARAAFALLKPTLRPHMKVQAPIQPGERPSIVLGKPLIPADPPEHATGFQMVILDRTKVDADGVLLNRYYTAAGQTRADYDAMYARIDADLQRYFDRPRYVLVLASFGLFAGHPPRQPLRDHLIAAGAGDALRRWIQTDTGNRPSAYILVGTPKENTAVELFDNEKRAVSQDVFFYWQRDVQVYTHGAGESRIGDAAATSSTGSIEPSPISLAGAR
ncbi:MAG: hypothetical protein JNL82_09360 [Myxococcales bacterium]|nr:hypothetical protein [Myxococcales bacterium]